jgi:hypothetical protein
MLYSFETTFCPNGRFLALREQHSLDNEQRIAIFEYSTADDLSVDLVGFHRLSHALYEMKRVAFHPKFAIFAFYSASMRHGNSKPQLESGAYIWKFKQSKSPFAIKGCFMQATDRSTQHLLIHFF